MSNLIPPAMKWKYGAKCSKTPDGTYIDVWEHPTIPKPTKTQMDIDVNDYSLYVSSGGQLNDQKEAKFNQDIIRAIGLTMKDYLNEIIAGRTTQIINSELRTKFKSYL